MTNIGGALMSCSKYTFGKSVAKSVATVSVATVSVATVSVATKNQLYKFGFCFVKTLFQRFNV